jgi:hypothetical protein
MSIGTISPVAPIPPREGSTGGSGHRAEHLAEEIEQQANRRHHHHEKDAKQPPPVAESQSESDTVAGLDTNPHLDTLV